MRWSRTSAAVLLIAQALLLGLSCPAPADAAEYAWWEPVQAGTTAKPAGDAWVWWEGEDPVETNFPGRTWFSAREDERDKLSGGEWLTNIDDRERGEPAAFARYRVTVPEEGTYQLWTRKFWKHGPFRWRFGERDWRVCGPDIALADSTPLRTHVVANWVHLGEVELDRGTTTFEIELLAETGEAKTAGFDAFLLIRGPFKPRGALKPDEASGLEEPGHFAHEPGADPFDDGAELDLRGMNERVAGGSGWMRRDGGGLRLGSGDRVRLWGVNLSAANAAQDRASVDYLARRLAKLGVNAIRYHSPLFTDDPDRPDPRRIEQLQYLVAAMKRQGIYTTLSFYFPLWYDVKPEHGIEGFESIENKKPFGLIFFDPTLQRMHRQWLDAALRSENPHGPPLAEEPALAMVELVNEDSFFFWTFTPQNVPEPHWSRLEKRFGEWLVERYGALDAARAAWDGDRADRDAFDAGRAALFGAWFMTRDGLRDVGEGRRKRIRDQVRFLAELQRDFYADLKRHAREELGYRGLVVASNWQTADPVLLDPIERWTYLAGDVIDRHGYFGGKHEGEGASYSVRRGHRYEDRTALASPGQTPLSFVQVADRPHIISELGWPQPNRYRLEMAPLAAGAASRLGIDGLFFFTVDNNYLDATAIAKFQLASPAAIQSFPAAAILFRRGWEQEHDPVWVERLGGKAMFELDPAAEADERFRHVMALDALRRADGPEGEAADAPGEVAPGLRRFLPVHRAYGGEGRVVERGAAPPEARREPLLVDPAGWLMLVNTPRIQGVVGAFERIHTRDLVFDLGGEFQSVLVTSLDGRPIAESSELLVQAIAPDRPYGFRVKDGVIEDLGKSPFQMRRINVTVQVIDARTPMTAQTLNAHGMAVGPMARLEQQEGGATLKLSPTHFYTVLRR